MKVRTVGDLVAALNQMPQDLPVLAGAHYDNDDALTNDVHLQTSLVEHIEAQFYMQVDPRWPSPTSFQAVTIS